MIFIFARWNLPQKCFSIFVQSGENRIFWKIIVDVERELWYDDTVGAFWMDALLCVRRFPGRRISMMKAE